MLLMIGYFLTARFDQREAEVYSFPLPPDHTKGEKENYEKD
jgi:hypothetical protein